MLAVVYSGTSKAVVVGCGGFETLLKERSEET